MIENHAKITEEYVMCAVKNVLIKNVCKLNIHGFVTTNLAQKDRP